MKHFVFIHCKWVMYGIEPVGEATISRDLVKNTAGSENLGDFFYAANLPCNETHPTLYSAL
jgi:hypothetical protein